ncbi:MAG: hypothetical protein JEZ02_21155 [Desulfatibacillum sp.]|nr:hypothetical protein [Desulfatibacillum sp.]
MHPRVPEEPQAQRPELFTALEKDLPELVERYLAQKALSCFSMVRPSDSRRKLEENAPEEPDLGLFGVAKERIVR